MIKEEDGAVVPANQMGPSSSTSGPIQTFDPLLLKPLQKKKQPLRVILKRQLPVGS